MLYLRRVTALGLLGITIVLGAATMAIADTSPIRPHVAFNLGSKHVGAARHFDEFNPGIGIGFTLPVDARGSEVGAEMGQYHNSVGGNSVYGTGSLDTPVTDLGARAQLRLGAFAGLAHYANARTKFSGGGVPMIGDWVVVGGAQATIRIDDTYDIRARVLPAGSAARALFTLQLAVRY